jgi:hypothetical protein
MQFADLKPLQLQHRTQELERAWDYYLPGSMYQVAGVEAVNSYTGMGFRVFGDRFCMEYDGLTQPCGYRNLWKSAPPGDESLADLMKIDTVVVQPEMTVGVETPPGWTVDSQSDAAVVLTRDNPLAWPDSRLSRVPDGVEVDAARSVGRLEEQVVITGGGGGKLVFAMLGWPGWTAEVDGRSVPVSHNPAGLLTVDLPADAAGTLTLSYEPPGLRPGIAAAGVGTLGAVALGVFALRRRRRTDEELETESDDTAPVVEGAPSHVGQHRRSE